VAIQTTSGGGGFNFGSGQSNINNTSSIGAAAGAGVAAGASGIYTGNQNAAAAAFENAPVESVDLGDFISNGLDSSNLESKETFETRWGDGEWLKEAIKNREEQAHKIEAEMPEHYPGDTPGYEPWHNLPDIKPNLDGMHKIEPDRPEHYPGDTPGYEPWNNLPGIQPAPKNLPNPLPGPQGGGLAPIPDDWGPKLETWEPKQMELPPELDPRRRTGLAPEPSLEDVRNRFGELREVQKPDHMYFTNDGTNNNRQGSGVEPVELEVPDWMKSRPTGGLSPVPDSWNSDHQIQQMPEDMQPLEYRHDIYPGNHYK
jgi:hypothetical protein